MGTLPGATRSGASKRPTFARGTRYAMGAVTFAAKEGLMKAKRTSKPRIKDLPVSEPRAKVTKGGDSVSRALDGIFKAAATAAQKVG